jgi:hypothetical protein
MICIDSYLTVHSSVVGAIVVTTLAHHCSLDRKLQNRRPSRLKVLGRVNLTWLFSAAHLAENFDGNLSRGVVAEIRFRS